MKNRDMIEAFKATLRDLPVPEQEERLQLFIEKVEGLDRAPGGWEENAGPSDGWEPPRQAGERMPGGGRRVARSQPAPRKPALSLQVLTIALAVIAVVEAVTIGLLLLFGGKKTEPEDSLPSHSETVTESGLPSESPSAPSPSGMPSVQPAPSQTASPSPSASESAGPQDTGVPPTQSSGAQEPAKPGAMPSDTGTVGDTGTGDGSTPVGDTGTGDGSTPGGDTGTGDGSTPGGGDGTGDGSTPGGDTGTGDGSTPGGDTGTGDGSTPAGGDGTGTPAGSTGTGMGGNTGTGTP